MLSDIDTHARHGIAQAAASTTLDVIDGVCAAELERLARAILAWKKREPKKNGGANVGGWKSGYGALDRSDFAPLKAAIVAATGLAAFTSWAMVNANGSRHPRHIHYAQPGSAGGVFYVTSGDPMAPLVVETGLGELAIDPLPGRLVIWRRSMWHRMDTYSGTEPRISIAFEGVIQP